MSEPAVTATIPDPSGLVYETQTWQDMKTKLEAWGYQNISAKKLVAWKLFKKHCDDNYGKSSTNDELLLDPEILNITNFSSQTLRTALKARKIPFNHRSRDSTLFDLLKQWAVDNFPKTPLNIPASQLLDPSTLSVEHFSKETLMDALTLRRIAFDSRVEAQALFNLLEQWAIKTFPQPSITTVHDRNHPSHEKSISAGGGGHRPNDADAITAVGGSRVIHDIDPGDKDDYDDVCITTPRKRGRSDYDDVCDSGDRRVRFPPRFNEIWLRSAAFVSERGSRSDNTNHLESIQTCNLLGSDVIYLFHDRQYYFYSLSPSDAGSKIATLISSVEGGKVAPFEVCEIPPTMPTWRFTARSFAHFQAIEERSSRLRVAWPMAHDPKRSRPSPPPAPLPRLGDPRSHPVEIYADTIARALQEGPKTTRARTPRGNDLTAPAAAILSNDPDRLLDTGVVHIFRYLHHFHPWAQLRDGYDAYAQAAWAVDAWRVQLQPFHLTLLIRDVMKVDIRLFADLCHTMSTFAADACIDRQFDGIDKLEDLPTDLTIIGGDLGRLKSCLHNFGYTLTIVFHLHPLLAKVLFALVQSALTHAMSYQFGPADPHAPMMYFYIANRCQAFVAARFRRVLIGEWDTRDKLVEALKQPFPDLSVSSPFSADVLLIRSTGKAPECLLPSPGFKKPIPHPTGSPSPAPGPASAPGPSPTTPRVVTPAPAPAPTQQPGSTPKAGKRLCAWFNTREGCSMPSGQCKGEHRDAASNKEKKMITNFLKTHPDRHPK